MVITGTMAWTAIQSFQIRLTTNATNNGTLFHFDSIFIGGILPTKIPVCITLDDSNKESIDMANIMNSYGIPVSLFVIDTFVDNVAQSATYMTLNECKMMYNKGNHIGMHGDAVNEFVVTPTRMATASNWLRANGFTRDDGHLYGSYPNGSYNQATIDYAKTIGIRGLRSLAGKVSNFSVGVEPSSSAIYEGILNGGIADPFRITSDKPASTAVLTTNLNTAINKKAGYLTYNHTFSEVGSRTEWINMAKYLKTQIDAGTIECLTFPKFCQKYDASS
jgi:hypothetical protein